MRLIDADKLEKPVYAEEDNITGMGMSPDEMDGYNDAIDMMWNGIQQAPTVDAAIVVHAQWIGSKYDQETGDYMEKCSHCGEFSREYWKPHCSECGALMDLDEKNDLIAEYANLKAAMQRKNAALTEQISQMNGEAINRENEIANLKADADALRNKLADTEAARHE